jgi:hypothetical protein
MRGERAGWVATRGSSTLYKVVLPIFQTDLDGSTAMG